MIDVNIFRHTDSKNSIIFKDQENNNLKKKLPLYVSDAMRLFNNLKMNNDSELTREELIFFKKEYRAL